MATSGAINSTMTVLEVGNQAHRILGQLRSDKSMTAPQGQNTVTAINMMLKSWQANANHPWRVQDYDLEWPAATPDGTLDPTIVDIEDVRCFRSATSEIQLIRYERDEFNTLPNKSQVGAPTIYSVVKERNAYRLRLWPVPSTATDLVLTCARRIEDITSTAEEIDVPQEWMECIVYNVADRLAQIYGMTATPEAQDAKVKAAQLYVLMRDHQRSGSMFLQPA